VGRGPQRLRPAASGRLGTTTRPDPPPAHVEEEQLGQAEASCARDRGRHAADSSAGPVPAIRTVPHGPSGRPMGAHQDAIDSGDRGARRRPPTSSCTRRSGTEPEATLRKRGRTWVRSSQVALTTDQAERRGLRARRPAPSTGPGSSSVGMRRHRRPTWRRHVRRSLGRGAAHGSVVNRRRAGNRDLAAGPATSRPSSATAAQSSTRRPGRGLRPCWSPGPSTGRRRRA
jgi:hypothetical protein